MIISQIVTGLMIPFGIAYGTSMKPNIKTGDIFFMTGKDRTQINDGDVILFWSNQDILVLHRVVDYKHEGEKIPYNLKNKSYRFKPKALCDGYLTKGDNNKLIDQHLLISLFEPVSHDKIVGVATGVIPVNDIFTIMYNEMRKNMIQNWFCLIPFLILINKKGRW